MEVRAIPKPNAQIQEAVWAASAPTAWAAANPRGTELG